MKTGLTKKQKVTEQSKEDYFMYQSNPELTKLQQEQATVEQQLKQLQHKQQRLENRKSYYEKADRKKRSC